MYTFLEPDDYYMLRIFKFLKPYKKVLLGIVILLFFQSMADLYLPTLMSDIVDTGIITGDTNYILKVGGIMLLISLVGAAASIIASLLSAKTATSFSKDLREKVFTKAESFSLEEFDTLGTASLITRTTNDINQIQQVLILILRMMINAPIMCIGGVIMAVSKDAKLSLLLLVVIPIIAVIIGVVGKAGVPLFKAMQIKLDKLNLVLRENLVGIRVIRAFNRGDHEKERFRKSNKDLTDTAIKVNKLMAILMPAMMLIFNFTTIAIVWFGGLRIDSGNMQIGHLMAFIQYAIQIMFSLIMVSMMFIMIPRASASAARINEVLDVEPKINDPESSVEATDVHGFIEFKNVTYNYPGAENPALENINFTAKPGEITAIIGGTGSGKSTLVNLIPRFYEVTDGSILIDNIDIRNFSQQTLRKKIGLVPQKAILFSGTIEENIKYGKEDATLDEVKHAAKIAQASDFISNMKEGFDSPIAQGGNNVSGGQKQRLAIARALVRKPEIYVFDDSFSALDFKTDAKLRAALKGETKESTVIIVAQRVSSITDADRIIVLNDGKVEGIGTHKDLLNSCTVYKEIVASQLSEEEIAHE